MGKSKVVFCAKFFCIILHVLTFLDKKKKSIKKIAFRRYARTVSNNLFSSYVVRTDPASSA